MDACAREARLRGTRYRKIVSSVKARCCAVRVRARARWNQAIATGTIFSFLLVHSCRTRIVLSTVTEQSAFQARIPSSPESEPDELALFLLLRSSFNVSSAYDRLFLLGRSDVSTTPAWVTRALPEPCEARTPLPFDLGVALLGDMSSLSLAG